MKSGKEGPASLDDDMMIWSSLFLCSHVPPLLPSLETCVTIRTNHENTVRGGNLWGKFCNMLTKSVPLLACFCTAAAVQTNGPGKLAENILRNLLSKLPLQTVWENMLIQDTKKRAHPLKC